MVSPFHSQIEGFCKSKGKIMRDFIAPMLLFVGSHAAILFVAIQMYASGP